MSFTTHFGGVRAPITLAELRALLDWLCHHDCARSMKHEGTCRPAPPANRSAAQATIAFLSARARASCMIRQSAPNLNFEISTIVSQRWLKVCVVHGGVGWYADENMLRSIALITAQLLTM